MVWKSCEILKEGVNFIVTTLSLIKETLNKYNEASFYCTSSFQTQSVPLLHIIGEHFPDITILFIDTGYLFPETYQFKDELQAKFNLNVKTLTSELSYSMQKVTEYSFLFSHDPDRCCHINKVLPLESFLKPGDVWVSGIRKDQSKIRAQKSFFENDKKGFMRFHPMLNWTSKDVHQYIREHNLPKHPLEAQGYHSVGCVPCTSKPNLYDLRSGRWEGMNKTECGLHWPKE